MIKTTVSHAKATLSKLVDMVTHGEEVIISRSGKPVARIVHYTRPCATRTGGEWKGRVRIGADFDELPSDMQDSFEGRLP